MKRSEALAPLSRDHHHALDVALRLRRATPETADEAATRFLAFWRQDGECHFEIEERLLLDALPASTPDWPEFVSRIRGEHTDIRARAASLGDGERDVEALHELGQRVHDHVRFEERQLFMKLEESLPLDQLLELGAAIDNAHR
jgi:hypothetical protein